MLAIKSHCGLGGLGLLPPPTPITCAAHTLPHRFNPGRACKAENGPRMQHFLANRNREKRVQRVAVPYGLHDPVSFPRAGKS